MASGDGNIDAPVVVAILTDEEDADAITARIETAIGDGRQLYVSPVVRVEAAMSVTRRLAGKDKPATKEMLMRARAMVDQFFADLEAKDTMITADVANKALDAAQLYGKIVSSGQPQHGRLLRLCLCQSIPNPNRLQGRRL